MFVDAFGKFFECQRKTAARLLRVLGRLDGNGRDLVINVWLTEYTKADAFAF
jgi:hypothetical protein